MHISLASDHISVTRGHMCISTGVERCIVMTDPRRFRLLMRSAAIWRVRGRQERRRSHGGAGRVHCTKWRQRLGRDRSGQNFENAKSAGRVGRLWQRTREVPCTEAIVVLLRRNATGHAVLTLRQCPIERGEILRKPSPVPPVGAAHRHKRRNHHCEGRDADASDESDHATRKSVSPHIGSCSVSRSVP